MTDDALPASSRIGRVALRVTDLDRVLGFYRDVVGLRVRSRADAAATLGTDDATLLELRGDPAAAERPATAAGLFHTAFRVPTRAALADALARVREGWHLAGASDHHVSEALYLRDPEDNGVEIYRDRPRAEWPTTDDGRVRMVTERLDLDDLASEARPSGGKPRRERRPTGTASEASDGGGGAATVPTGTDVGHVHLEVTSLAAARECYVDALGLGVRQEMDGALFLAAGDYHHRVGCNVWNGRSEPAAGRGLSWFEVVVPDADALAAARERCERAGLAVRALDDGGVAVTDRDGIEVRLWTEGTASG